MGNRITRKLIRDLILTEVEDLFAPEISRSQNISEDSLDDQVDAFILKYEQDSILGESPKNDMMSESLENLSLLALMNEQDEPDEGDDAGVEDLADDPAPDAEAPADTDEFLVSDGGTIKRIDYSHIKGGGAYTKLLTTTISSNTILLYIYDDGSVEKKINTPTNHY